jgi:predicted RNase H-like HicB family nuclease
MAYLVCAEENERQWIAHVPDLPGCFTSSHNLEGAIQAIPKSVEAYLAWTASHGLHVSGITDPMVVAEVIRAWESDDGYEVNAFFASDRPPLIPDELHELEVLLKATREDLLASIEGILEDHLHREFSGERWTIDGILMHVARSEWWYLDRMGLGFAKNELPEDSFACLSRVRDHTLAVLPELVKRTGVITISGETWSARKVMRRMLWHERDHTAHIRKLRTTLPHP